MGIIPHDFLALLGIPRVSNPEDPMEVLSCMALRLRLEAFRNETMTARRRDYNGIQPAMVGL
jgi:hypothetical protein